MFGFDDRFCARSGQRAYTLKVERRCQRASSPEATGTPHHPPNRRSAVYLMKFTLHPGSNDTEL
jgi:hypothetical protein